MDFIKSLTYMSQYQQAMLVSLLAILMTCVTRKFIVTKYPFIYQIVAMIWALIIEILFDILLVLNYRIVWEKFVMYQEVITCICSMLMAMIMYDTIKSIIINYKNFIGGKNGRDNTDI